MRSRTRNQAAQSHSQGTLPRTFWRGKVQISTHVPCGGHVCTRQLIRGSRETDTVDRENIFNFWLVAHNETGRLRRTGSNFLMTSNRCSSFTNSGLLQMTGLEDTGALSSKSFSSEDSRKDADGAFLGFMVEPGHKKSPHTVQTPEQTRIFEGTRGCKCQTRALTPQSHAEASKTVSTEMMT